MASAGLNFGNLTPSNGALQSVNELIFKEVLGEERVLGSTVAWGATLQSPGVCELTSEPDALSFSLGSISAKRSRHFAKVKELLG